MKDWMAVASWAGLTDLEVLESPHAGVFRMFAQGLMDLRESLGALSCVAEEGEHEEKHRRREREQSELKGRVDLMMQSEARRCDGAEAVEKSQHEVIAVVERLKDMVDIQKNHMDRAIGLIRKVEAARRSTHAEMLSRIAKLGKRLDGLESQLIGHFQLHAKQDPPVVIPSVWSADPPLDEIGSHVTESTGPEELLQKAADMQPEDSAGPAPEIMKTEYITDIDTGVSSRVSVLRTPPNPDEQIQALVDEYWEQDFKRGEFDPPDAVDWEYLDWWAQDEIKRDPRFPHCFTEPDATCKVGDCIEYRGGRVPILGRVVRIEKHGQIVFHNGPDMAEQWVLPEDIRWLARGEVTP